MLRYLILAVILSGFSCTDINSHRPEQQWISGSIELKGMYPRFDCKGFEKQVIHSFDECIKRARAQGESVLVEDNCVRWSKQTWCSTE